MAALAGIGRRAGEFHAATLDTDESVYIVMARRWLEGDLPYVAVYDMHPVGLPALFAAATWLLDDGLLAARLMAALAVAGTCSILFFASARFTRSRTTGVIAALLYGTYMMRPEALVPNTELFNNVLVTLAACLLFGQAERIRAARPVQRTPVLIGALMLGAGLQIKYVVAPEAAGFCLAFLLYWRWHKAELRDLVGLAAGMMMTGLAPTLAAVAYFWSHGALEPFWDANVESNIAYATMVPPLDGALYDIAVGIKPLAPLAAGAVLWLALLSRQRRDGAARTQLLVHGCALWLDLSALNVMLPMKFFQHYFYALIPPLCLLAAMLVASIRSVNPRLALMARAAAVLILAAPPLRAIAREIVAPTSELSRATELATACIREHPASRPGLYVFNWDPVLYETTRIPPPTRFVLPVELAEYSDSAGVDSMAEIGRILAGRPGHVVVARPSRVAFSPAASALVERALTNPTRTRYELVCSVPFRAGKDAVAQAMVYRLR